MLHGCFVAFDDDDFLDALRVFQRLVGDALERNALAGTQGNVRGDEQAAGGVVDAPGQRFGAEPAEHDRMNDAQPRAGEHGDGQFGNHRQINGNAVALFDAERFQHVGEFADFLVQLRVGERPRRRPPVRPAR